MVEFVNPYTFIPLPATCRRSKPNGHERLEHFSGALKVTLRAETPLIIRDSQNGTAVPTRNGKVVIPGSALHGAVRSLHEALCGGCLRVIDPQYVPSYRQPVESGLDDLRIAVVASTDEGGGALAVRLCEQETWIDATAMRRALGPVYCGELLYVREDLLLDKYDWRNDRYQIDADLVHGQTAWISRQDGPGMAAPVVAFITDIGARNPSRGHYWAVGPLGDEIVQVSDEAHRAYALSVADADDVRLATGQATTVDGPTEPVTRGNQLLGHRYAASPRLQVGQPVWVATEGDGAARRVVEIRLAKIWRKPGRYPLADRVGDFLPCSDRRRSDGLMLCPSCAVFGSAEEREAGRAENDASVQLSYAGHVYVGDAISTRPVQQVVDAVTSIAPLMGPHPGAGHFYLKAAPPGYRGETTWGSPADDPTPRPIRGRKFYWRARTGETRSPRAVPRGAQNLARAVAIQPVRVGTEFTTEIQFVNLTESQVGGLVVSLQPSLLYDDAVLSLGGGKPFGFGTVSTGVELTAWQGAAQRYGPAEPLATAAVLNRCVAAFRRWRDETGGFAPVDAAARHVLALDFVPDELISYPFDGTQRHAPDPLPGYLFFKAARGGVAATAPAPVFLPDPAGASSAQAMDNKPPPSPPRRPGRGPRGRR